MAEQVVKLYVVPLGHNRFSSIAARDGLVQIEQVANLVGSDGLGLQLVPIEDWQPAAAPIIETGQ